VVATGIDAEIMAASDKVHPLRPHLKPLPLKPEPRTEIRTQAQARTHAQAQAIYASPVHAQHAQVEALAEELAAPQPSPAEDYILGGEDAPQLVEEALSIAEKYPVTETFAPIRAPEPEKRGWSFLGRKKARSDLRTEPAPSAPVTAPPRTAARATAQPMRSAQPAPAPQAPPTDDLFPDHARDEQFEIPAFLRRQSS
jgi:hypothetical protein